MARHLWRIKPAGFLVGCDAVRAAKTLSSPSCRLLYQESGSENSITTETKTEINMMKRRVTRVAISILRWFLGTLRT